MTSLNDASSKALLFDIIDIFYELLFSSTAPQERMVDNYKTDFRNPNILSNFLVRVREKRILAASEIAKQAIVDYIRLNSYEEVSIIIETSEYKIIKLIELLTSFFAEIENSHQLSFFIDFDGQEPKIKAENPDFAGNLYQAVASLQRQAQQDLEATENEHKSLEFLHEVMYLAQEWVFDLEKGYYDLTIEAISKFKKLDKYHNSSSLDQAIVLVVEAIGRVYKLETQMAKRLVGEAMKKEIGQKNLHSLFLKHVNLSPDSQIRYDFLFKDFVE